MSKIKGMAISDIIATAFLLAVIMVIISFMFIVNTIHSFTSDPKGYLVTFVKAVNEPFLSLEAISHLQYDGRQSFEHMDEAVISGSLDGSNSGGLDDALGSFMDIYNKAYYSITLKNSTDDTIMQVTSFEGKALESITCGDDAYCTDVVVHRQDVQLPGSGLIPQTTACPIGTKKIPDDNNICAGTVSTAQVCCQSDPVWSSKNYQLVRCGLDGQGICQPLLDKDDPSKHCVGIFTEIPDSGNDCQKANSGLSPYCCTPVTSKAATDVQATQKADVPILYKGLTLFEPKYYKCQDSRTDICNGEYVSGLCGGNHYIKCCVTDQIKCKPPNSNNFCMDQSDCLSIGGTTADNLCPDPNSPGNPSVYKCCTGKANPFTDDSTGKGQPSVDYGNCYLAGNPYTDAPLSGTLEVTTG